MKTRTHSTRAISALVLILATAICFPVHWCQETRLYDTCSQLVRCGDIEFGYPFWGLGRPDYCGHPGFHLTCRSSVPELVLKSVNYRVLYANSKTHTITVARNDLWSNICPEHLQGINYDSTLFKGYTYVQENVSLYYRCQHNMLSGIAPLGDNFRFNCDVNGTQSHSYFYRTSLITTNITNFLNQCNYSFTVPVHQSWADQLSYVTSSERDLKFALRVGFNLHWMANKEDCDRCISSNGQCGSNSASPELFVCYCASGNVSSTCNNSNERAHPRGSKGTKLKFIIGVSCSFTGIMFLLFVILCQKMRLLVTPKQPEIAYQQIEVFIRNYGSLAPKRYKYSEIKKMTNSFLNKLGRGGYGSVYKGELPNGDLVAVKLLSETTGRGEDFINEVASIGRTSHVNIVTLIGFCFERKKRALLYEFMPNGSLDNFLHVDGSHLDWNTLFQIAKGIARGLEYLHGGCNTRIVHFDIKPHNILLDEEFVPKIADFGLAKLCKKKQSTVSVTGARGTAGYMAPEVFFRDLGGASHKSDVYSYGMLVLEMTGARKHNMASRRSTSEAFFPDWIYEQVEAGSDLKDYGTTTEGEVELARKMMVVGLWCIQYDPSDRPSISKVIEMLEGSLESLQVPLRRFWSSPKRSIHGISQLDMLSSITYR